MFSNCYDYYNTNRSNIKCQGRRSASRIFGGFNKNLSSPLAYRPQAAPPLSVAERGGGWGWGEVALPKIAI
jgi:hypothetical protein